MEVVEGEEIVSGKDMPKKIPIVLPPPPNKNVEAPVTYKVFNGILKENFTTFGNIIYKLMFGQSNVIKQQKHLTDAVVDLNKRVVKLEAEKKKSKS